jgi:hypothetical protein
VFSSLQEHFIFGACQCNIYTQISRQPQLWLSGCSACPLLISPDIPPLVRFPHSPLHSCPCTCPPSPSFLPLYPPIAHVLVYGLVTPFICAFVPIRSCPCLHISSASLYSLLIPTSFASLFVPSFLSRSHLILALARALFSCSCTHSAILARACSSWPWPAVSQYVSVM